MEELGFSPNNNQKGIAANAIYYMTSKSHRVQRMIVSFPPGHGKSRIVPTFIKTMSLLGNSVYAKVLFLHEEQMKDDFPLIEKLVKDAGDFELEAEVVGDDGKNYDVPAAKKGKAMMPLLLVDEVDSVLLDKRCTFGQEWFVLGLTACEREDYSAAEIQYIEQTANFTLKESNVQDLLPQHDIRKNATNLDDFVSANASKHALMFYIDAADT